MKKVMVFITAILFLMPFYSLATTINIPGDQPNIQAGIDAAVDGDIVLLADGTYTGTGNYNINFNGKEITVRSVNGPNNCIIDCQQRGRGFLFYAGETETSVLDGLTVRNGKADSGSGGGVYTNGSSPSIINCMFENNTASNSGGAIISNSILSFSNCTFSNNSVSGIGGAARGAFIFSNCTFSNNSASGDGGAVSGDSTFSNCTFSNNSASGDGGAVKGSSIFNICTFIGNKSSGYGGAVYNGNHSFMFGFGMNSKSPSFAYCNFINNKSLGDGGAVYSRALSSFTNCIFTGNMAYSNNSNGGPFFILKSAGNGGAVNLSSSTSFLINCTFANNNASNQGGGVWCDIPLTPEDPIIMRNCIFRGNVAPEGVQIYEKEKPLLITYSDIQGGHFGSYNTDMNPMFVDAVNGDLHLQSNSPCIDAGTFDGAPATDFDNNPRPIGSGFDMGAYEYQILSQCRADNLSGCTNQTDCHSVGGYWYDNVCNASPKPTPSPGGHNAIPSSALSIVDFPTSVTPANNQVQVGNCNDVMIQPTLAVPSSDVGKTATLIMYIYLPDMNFGMNVPSKTKVLTSETKFDLLSNAIDFSTSANLNVYIYYGYMLGDKIKYNAYSIVVGSSCEN